MRSRILSKSRDRVRDHVIFVQKCELSRPKPLGRKIIQHNVKGLKKKITTIMRKNYKRSHNVHKLKLQKNLN
jgi:hypothetical protein